MDTLFARNFVFSFLLLDLRYSVCLDLECFEVKVFEKKIKKLKLGNCEKILVSLIFSYCACFIYIYIFLVRFLKILEMFRVGSSFQKF